MEEDIKEYNDSDKDGGAKKKDLGEAHQMEERGFKRREEGNTMERGGGGFKNLKNHKEKRSGIRKRTQGRGNTRS